MKYNKTLLEAKSKLKSTEKITSKALILNEISHEKFKTNIIEA